MKYYLLEADDNPSTSAEVDSRDLPRTETIKSLILDVTAQQSSTTAATRSNLAAQIDQIRIKKQDALIGSVINFSIGSN